MIIFHFSFQKPRQSPEIQRFSVRAESREEALAALQAFHGSVTLIGSREIPQIELPPNNYFYLERR